MRRTENVRQRKCGTAEAIKQLLSQYEPLSKILPRVHSRDGREGTCCICAGGCDRLQVTYIWDLQMAEALDLAYQADLQDDIPICVEDAMNGLLLCPTCHSEFSGPDRRLNITADGTIVAKGFVHDEFRRSLNGKKVSWAHSIGRRHYPSAALLEIAFSQQRPAGKYEREREHEQRTTLYYEVTVQFQSYASFTI